jgi:hypothetical protein
MSDSPVSAAETPVEKKARKLAEQDQKIANAINEAATMMTAAAEDADLQALLAPRGYDTAAITAAITTLQEPAQAAFNARQVAIGALSSASAALATAEDQERKDFSDYREIARTVFPAPTDKQALGLNGAAPRDLEKFLTLAQASYAAGKKAPYTAKLTVRGYSPATIDAELAGLKGVASLAKARAISAGAAQKATATRDKAAKALAAWMSEFRKVAKRTLRGRPDLLAKLGM